MTTSDPGNVAAILEPYQTAWRAMDFAALKALWDTDDPEPYYVPEEADMPMTSWDEIQAYWDANTQILVQMNLKAWDPEVHMISDDIARMVFKMAWGGTLRTFNGESAPLAGEQIVISLLRRKPDGWKFIHYMETAAAPILHVIRLAEARAIEVEAMFK